MLDTFLDRASGLLDRHFLTAWWFPTLIAGAVALLLGIAPYGLSGVWGWWTRQDGLTQAWLLLGALLLVTVFAYVLQAFTRPLVQFYEGYWPRWLWRWSQSRAEKSWGRWRRERTQAAKQDLTRYAALQDRLYHEYPSQAERLLPTRLGNVLRAAEDYPITTYGMDGVFWWPRLMLVLPEAAQKEINDALTPLLAMLNFATLIGVVVVGGAIHLWSQRTGGWQASVAVLAGGLLVAWLSYQAAIRQARGYGQHIRTAVDVYRFDLFKALRQSPPTSPQEERALWRRLTAWLYNQDRGAAQGLTYAHDDQSQE